VAASLWFALYSPFLLVILKSWKIENLKQKVYLIESISIEAKFQARHYWDLNSRMKIFRKNRCLGKSIFIGCWLTNGISRSMISRFEFATLYHIQLTTLPQTQFSLVFDWPTRFHTQLRSYSDSPCSITFYPRFQERKSASTGVSKTVWVRAVLLYSLQKLVVTPKYWFSSSEVHLEIGGR
jgi:hypothetical protein